MSRNSGLPTCCGECDSHYSISTHPWLSTAPLPDHSTNDDNDDCDDDDQIRRGLPTNWVTGDVWTPQTSTWPGTTHGDWLLPQQVLHSNRDRASFFSGQRRRRSSRASGYARQRRRREVRWLGPVNHLIAASSLVNGSSLLRSSAAPRSVHPSLLHLIHRFTVNNNNTSRGSISVGWSKTFEKGEGRKTMH